MPARKRAAAPKGKAGGKAGDSGGKKKKSGEYFSLTVADQRSRTPDKFQPNSWSSCNKLTTNDLHCTWFSTNFNS